MKHTIVSKKIRLSPNVGDIFENKETGAMCLTVENEIASGMITLLNLSTDKIETTSDVAFTYNFVGVAEIGLRDKS